MVHHQFESIIFHLTSVAEPEILLNLGKILTANSHVT